MSALLDTLLADTRRLENLAEFAKHGAALRRQEQSKALAHYAPMADAAQTLAALREAVELIERMARDCWGYSFQCREQFEDTWAQETPAQYEAWERLATDAGTRPAVDFPPDGVCWECNQRYRLAYRPTCCMAHAGQPLHPRQPAEEERDDTVLDGIGWLP